MTEIKPLNWKPVPGIGYTVVRRPDGGMDYTFTDLSEETIKHWQEFSHQHLLDADRLTRNLYDLRLVEHVSQKAITTAIEVNSDPAARNIRLAVLVANGEVADAIRKIAALALTPASAAIKIFTDGEEAENWLSRPLDQLA
ncbi:MAG TPA: hypothetical protein VJZ78_06960 [Anaerolineales bacterium]|nr:hypothetical protein [Anaerolineales bacterium]